MKNKELRKIASTSLKGKKGRSIGLAMSFYIFLIIINILLINIPIAREFVLSMIYMLLMFGFIKQMIQFFNGEKVKNFDFLLNTTNNLKKILGIIFLNFYKVFPAILTLMIGKYFLSNVNEIMGNVIICASVIWLCIVALNYSMLGYTFAYNINLTPKEIIKKTEQEIKTKFIPFVSMNLYVLLKWSIIWGLTCGGMMFLSFVDKGFYAQFHILLIFVIPVVFLLVFFISNVICIPFCMIELLSCCNEFYKYHILKNIEQNSDDTNDVIEQNFEDANNPIE